MKHHNHSRPRHSRPRLVAITTGLAGVGMAAAIVGGGVASAAPAPAPTTVPGTSCTVAQVERALAKEDPALWKRIESNPRAKKHFESTIVLTPEQRKAKRDEMAKKHPERAKVREFLKEHNVLPGKAREDMKAVHAAVEKAKLSCSQF